MTAYQGPIFDRVHAVLASDEAYAAFRGGQLGAGGFASLLENKRPVLLASGVPPDDVDYAKRYPPDREEFIKRALYDLTANGVLESAAWDPQIIVTADQRQANFVHAGRSTYIYPEESGLLAALAAVHRPLRAIFLGSYYGFWAAAAVPIIAAGGGVAVLVDPDETCSAIARANFASEIAAGNVQVACYTGEAFLSTTQDVYDLAVIDAELPRNHGVAAHRGKGIYALLLKAVLPHLRRGALLVCHNILLEDATGVPLFKEILARNWQELGPFRQLALEHFPNWTEIATTEGVGVGRFSRTAP